MNTSIDKLVNELEEMYENSCLLKDKNKQNYKNCLALDEQELAIMHMCVKGLANQEGICKEDYISKGLFIILKDRNIDKYACKHSRVKHQPLQYKRYEKKDQYSLEKMTQLLLVYYAALLLYANENNTGDFNDELRRHYFKVYAYFACICPKTFCILFFNQIHLFMSKICHKLPANELRDYLEYTKELWEEYNSLLSNQKRIEISEEVITQFSEIMSYDEDVFFDNLIQMQNLCEVGFLAFDFKSGDTLRGYRFKMILIGIEYFQWYLKYLKEEILNNSFREESLLRTIDDIREETKALKKIFMDFLKREEEEPNKFEREFDNIYGLLNSFHEYCKNKVTLIDI